MKRKQFLASLLALIPGIGIASKIKSGSLPSYYYLYRNDNTYNLLVKDSPVFGEISACQNLQYVNEMLTKAPYGSTLIIHSGTYMDTITVTDNFVSVRGASPMTVINVPQDRLFMKFI